MGNFVNGKVTNQTIEDLTPDDPVWSGVGTHLHFNEHINQMVDDLLRILLGSYALQIPYIGVHIRRGDFITMDRVSGDELDEYVQGVEMIKKKLRNSRASGTSWSERVIFRHSNKYNFPVLFATDERDPAFLRKLTSLGWLHINSSSAPTQPE